MLVLYRELETSQQLPDKAFLNKGNILDVVAMLLNSYLHNRVTIDDSLKSTLISQGRFNKTTVTPLQ